ncbi:unnamed protein product [Lepeophtheirus salmonis]|uniref:(salmon louse) hypothetical protein n=1 Tax=Lepeophtheirus salmonis TaxID=72036 RepID=A0A7R8CD18_LEPSM|nr:unnamed protein product [Lepeophtheirus salmonis]CAF2776622.1 unnamed protein product [Lepeophtheirus salmonis]
MDRLHNFQNRKKNYDLFGSLTYITVTSISLAWSTNSIIQIVQSNLVFLWGSSTRRVWVFMTLLPTIILNTLPPSRFASRSIGAPEIIGWVLWGVGFSFETSKLFWRDSPLGWSLHNLCFSL